MSDREQLLELRNRLIDGPMIAGGNYMSIKPGDIDLIDRLLARFPYKEKEYILVKHQMDTYWREAKFVAVCSEGVVAVTDDLVLDMFSQHKPIEKTRTLEVPEEIIEMAKQATTPGFHAASPLMEVCQWLAREAGKGE